MPGIREDRTKIRVLLPFEESLDQLLASHKEKNQLSAQMKEVMAQMKEVKAQMGSMTAKVNSLEAYRAKHEKRDLVLHEANTLVLFIKALAVRTNKKLSHTESKGNSDEHAVSMRLSNAHTLWKEDQWVEKTSLPIKYHTKLKSVSNARNDIAHESTVEFAQLLCDPFFKDNNPGEYEYWTPIFQYMYRDEKSNTFSIDQIATMDHEDLKRLFPRGPDPSRKSQGK